MKNKTLCFLFGGILLVISCLCLFLPKPDFSESERRVLAKFPDISAENIFSGNFASGFEEYTTDTFPFRDFFRTIKAYASKYIFGLSDNNDLFLKDGHLGKIDYPQNEESLKNASEHFSSIYDKYIKDTNSKTYLSIIPDKSYFIDNILKLDYNKLVTFMTENMAYAEYIDIFPYLSLNDYYTTDSHWRQENISDVAFALSDKMGVDNRFGHSIFPLGEFRGVYFGQSAMKVSPDKINAIHSPFFDKYKVTSYDSGKPEDAVLFDFEKFNGRDPYDVFLSGGNALMTIENPYATEPERELILFRDSFGSSIAHYFLRAYSKVTLIDIRYINSSMLGNFVDFENSDILFLYSSSLLNSSFGFK